VSGFSQVLAWLIGVVSSAGCAMVAATWPLPLRLPNTPPPIGRTKLRYCRLPVPQAATAEIDVVSAIIAAFLRYMRVLSRMAH